MICITLVLLITSIIIFACILCNKLSSKIGVPTLLIFIILGMIFGSDGIVKIPFENFEFAEQICSSALIFIMFYGGFGTNWEKARPVAARSILLSSAGVILTAVLTGVFCCAVLNMDLLEGFLIGAVLSSTDAASVFSILRSKRLNLKYGTASMLELESGSNDPVSYMLTAIILSVMEGKNSASAVFSMVFSQIIFGIVIGVLIAVATLFILKHIKFSAAGLDTIFIFAIAILSYALPGFLGGNGYLSVYIVGIILGNSNIQNKKSLVYFFDVFTGLMQMLIFFLLGLLAFPSQIPGIILPALAIALFLTFVARPVAIAVLLTPFRAKLPQQLVVSWAGLRGAASIVFAVMVTVSSASTKNDIFHIVFCIVLLSIAFQGSFLPLVARKLDMIDTNSNVLKTFNDYTDETEIQFIRMDIDKHNIWNGKQIKDIALPSKILLVMIQRNGENIVPRGNTYLCESDTVVLATEGYQDEQHIMLKEVVVDKEHKWCNKQIFQLKMSQESLIIMIRRQEQTIIPDGQVQILCGDIVVVYSNR